MRLLQLLFALTLVLQSRTFELQDTIHKLIEENIYLHDQLENLTKALRELKWMLIHHSTGKVFKHYVLLGYYGKYEMASSTKYAVKSVMLLMNI